jgi:hypothetical protein
MGNTKQWFCIVVPTDRFRHITSNLQAVATAMEMGWEVWYNCKRVN